MTENFVIFYECTDQCRLQSVESFLYLKNILVDTIQIFGLIDKPTWSMKGTFYC